MAKMLDRFKTVPVIPEPSLVVSPMDSALHDIGIAIMVSIGMTRSEMLALGPMAIPEKAELVQRLSNLTNLLESRLSNIPDGAGSFARDTYDYLTALVKAVSAMPDWGAK